MQRIAILSAIHDYCDRVIRIGLLVVGAALLCVLVDGVAAAQVAAPEPMLTARTNLRLVSASNERLYALGGTTKNEPLTFSPTIDEYDPVANVWRLRNVMTNARSNFGAAATADGKIYTFGGNTIGGNILATVEAFDTQLNSWSTRRAMPMPRMGAAAVTAPSGKIYVIGGYNTTSDRLNTIDEYDPASDSWAPSVASLPIGTYLASAALSSSGKVYVVSGWNYACACEIWEFDPTSRAVRTMQARLPYQTPIPSTTAIEQFIYISVYMNPQQVGLYR